MGSMCIHVILLIEFYVDSIVIKDFIYSAVGDDTNAIDSQKQTPSDTAREGKVQLVQLDTPEAPVEETVSILCILLLCILSKFPIQRECIICRNVMSRV